MPSSRRPLILLVHKMHESGMRLLREAGELRMAPDSSPATLQAEVIGAEAMLIRTGGVIDAPLLDRGKHLKVIGRHGVGYDQIDIEAATERGIQVVYTPGANTQSVAEHVFAFMIGLSKHFPHMSMELARGNYLARTSLTGREIAGKTLGIIGFGRIGRRVGEIAHLGFGMKVLYHDIVPAPEEVELRSGARRVSRGKLLESSDYITLHVPLDGTTRGMIDRSALAQVRPGAILINTSRGPVVDEDGGCRGPGRGPALGLRSRRLRGGASSPGPPVDRPPRCHAHASQRGTDRGRPAEHGHHGRPGRRLGPPGHTAAVSRQ